MKSIRQKQALKMVFWKALQIALILPENILWDKKVGIINIELHYLKIFFHKMGKKITLSLFFAEENKIIPPY